MPLSRRSSPPTKTDRSASSRGSLAPLVALHVAVALSCCAVVVRTGAHVIARARAQSAADSVALALVTQDSATARRIAAVLGARIMTVNDDGATVSVRVDLSGERRSATAVRAVQNMQSPQP